MIALPFLYFGIWAYKEYKTNGYNVLTFILCLYAVSALFSIFIEVGNFYTPSSCPKVELGVIAPFLYCLLLTICIKPFSRLKNIEIKPLSERAEKFLYYISYAYLIIFLIVLSVAWQRLIFVLAAGDQLAEIRNEQYSGDTVSFYDHLSGWRRYICAICATLSPSSFLMVFVFGYMLAYSKKPILFKIVPLIGSFTPFILSINIADRSQFIFWIVLLLFSLTVFHRQFSKKTKMVMVIILGLVLFYIFSYLMSVTASRFEMRQGGVEGGLILYAGQPYINFCRFINDVTPPFFSLNVVFPTISRYLFHGQGYFDLIHEVERSNGNTPLAVFPTFIGIIYSACGLLVSIVYITLYRIIADKVCRGVCILNDYKSLIYMWIVALVPVLGFIGYFYMGSNNTIAIVVWLIIARIIGKKDML